jgi:hypothetical protein
VEQDPFSPEERSLFDLLAEIVHEELRVQIMMGRLERDDGERRTAVLIADAVWTAFELKERQSR